MIAHDEWNYSPPKLAKMPIIELGSIKGVLPFDGVRNPGSRSSTSHKVWFGYRTPANDWQIQLGICESAAEFAVALEALMSPNIYDVKFQPMTVRFALDGKQRHYTHDLLVVYKCGFRQLIFVRNGKSLKKPKTQREIDAIFKATTAHQADGLIVVNASDYSRQRRENLFRMHQLLQEDDPEADELVLSTARGLKTLWQMKDIFPHVDLDPWRVFRACYRLVALKHLKADLDNVLLETSRIEVAA
ncbi:hypothetical protein CLV78_1115 [Aliiruegeria haliotis]|uniref:TnsA endonuclease-like protein n=2 Tax=Aliiruegeria haliotis TaxID=1280846 RepID=A0A2T0RIA5_9RHOB|nr:hypothetical protein CLV78_1115 [Aliiruegeria haliotis]